MAKQAAADFDAALHSELQPDEKVVWQGAPDADEMARRNFSKCAAGAVGTVIVAGWIYGIVRGMIAGLPNADFQALIFLLIGLPLVVFCVVLLLSPGSARAASQRTRYTITNTRVLVFRGQNVRSVDIAEITQVTTVPAHGSFADIIISTSETQIGFSAVSEAERVAELIRSLISS